MKQYLAQMIQAHSPNAKRGGRSIPWPEAGRESDRILVQEFYKVFREKTTFDTEKKSGIEVGASEEASFDALPCRRSTAPATPATSRRTAGSAWVSSAKTSTKSVIVTLSKETMAWARENMSGEESSTKRAVALWVGGINHPQCLTLTSTIDTASRTTARESILHSVWTSSLGPQDEREFPQWDLHTGNLSGQGA